jgi:hypothetical protein
MDIQVQPPSLPFVATVPARRPSASPGGGRPWLVHAQGAAAVPGPPRVLLVCGVAREGLAAEADIARTLRLVHLALGVFGAAGVESEVLDLSRLTADGSRRIRPCEGCFASGTPLCRRPGGCCPNQALDQPEDPAGGAAADGVLILLPAHWRRTSVVLQMMIDRGMGPALSGAPSGDDEAAGEWGAAGPSRAYGLVVHGDLTRSLQVRRALCDRLDWIGLIDACEQARLEHFLGLQEPACPGMPPEGDAALESETRAAAGALVQAMNKIRAGWLDRGNPLLARVWPR